MFWPLLLLVLPLVSLTSLSLANDWNQYPQGVEPFLHEIRIYYNASTDVFVTTVKVNYSKNQPKIGFRLNANYDHNYFKIDPKKGIIKTKKNIDRNVGEVYLIQPIVSFGPHEEVALNVSIRVSEYNVFAPQFEQNIYSTKMHWRLTLNTTVTTLTARDDDPIGYNSEVFYRFGNLAPATLPFLVDSLTGEVTLKAQLLPKKQVISFDVIASDGGSPQRYSTAIVQITVTALSEPIVTTINSTNSSATMCWLKPMYGDIEGYLVRYHTTGDVKETHINMTASKSPSDCASLYDLRPESKYEATICAWNGNDLGMETMTRVFRTKAKCNCSSRGVCQQNSTCLCSKGYFGASCEIFDPCNSQPCLNNGVCNSIGSDITCICARGYSGARCQNALQCPSGSITTSKGTFFWPTTDTGLTITLRCPFNSGDEKEHRFASRRCVLTKNNKPFWEQIKDENCKNRTYSLIEAMAINLKEMTSKGIDAENKSLPEITSKLADILVYAKVDQKVAVNFLDVVGNLLEFDEKLWANTSSGQKVLEMVNDLISSVPLETGDEYSLESANVALKVIKVDPEKKEPLAFQPRLESTQSLPNLPIITLPDNVLQEEKGMKMSYRVKFVAYKNGKLFRRTNSEASNDHPVIEAGVHMKKVTQLAEPVTYLMAVATNRSESSRLKCVFWDEREMYWSSEGMATTLLNDSVLCLSSHLTAFSLLLDFSPGATPAPRFFSLVTYIGCLLSVGGLCLTLLTYTLFRSLNRDNSGKILLNLVLSLLGMNCAFLMGTYDTTILSFDSCVFVAVLVHYFVLTSLAWMCVEAIHIYQLLIYVFKSSETHYMMKRVLVAWFLPMVWVIFTLLIKPSLYYNSQDYCLIAADNRLIYYISYLTPASLLILINLIVFAMVTRVIFAPRMSTTINDGSNQGNVTLAQIRGAFTVMTLLGITWVFGALALGKLRIVFQFLFCVLNSLQGLLIFFVRVLQYPEARSAWKQLLTRGTLKQRKGPPPKYGSWLVHSNSNSLYKNSNSDATRKQSSDSANTVLTNSSSGSSTKDKLIARVENSWTTVYEAPRAGDGQRDRSGSSVSKTSNPMIKGLISGKSVVRKGSQHPRNQKRNSASFSDFE